MVSRSRVRKATSPVYMQEETTGIDIKMEVRQKRIDINTAKVVARGVNILAVRNRSLAQNYMRIKHVPQHVIERVLDMPASRRAASAEQEVSEALVPSTPHSSD